MSTFSAVPEALAHNPGNVRTEPGTGNRVMEEPEPEEPVTGTEPVEP